MPAADVPAPIMEVTVSGYVKADFVYDFHNDLGDTASQGKVKISSGDVPHFHAFARESRFRIKSRSDTAVGQIRTLIEGDFFGSEGNQLISNSHSFRLRHAWGEWDISPNTTLGFGQFWSIWFPIGLSAAKLDFTSDAGQHFMRQAQFRITNRNGPWTWMFNVANPETDIRTAGGTTSAESIGNPAGANDPAPDFNAAVIYKPGGGHIFKLSAVGRVLSTDKHAGAIANDTAFGFGLQANVKIALSSAFAVYATGIWGDGIGRYLLDNVGGAATVKANGNLNTHEAYGLGLGFSLKLNPTTSFNVQGGYFHNGQTPSVPAAAGPPPIGAILQTGYSAHVTLLWQPVSKFRLGIEGIYRYDKDRNISIGTTRRSNDNFRLHAAAIFFF